MGGLGPWPPGPINPALDQSLMLVSHLMANLRYGLAAPCYGGPSLADQNPRGYRRDTCISSLHMFEGCYNLGAPDYVYSGSRTYLEGVLGFYGPQSEI